MRFLCLLLVLLFLPFGLFTATAESADDRLSAALEALGAASVSVEGEFPGITASAAESTDDFLFAALEAIGVVSISVEGEFPGITASAASSLSAEDAQALLDSTLPLVAAQDTRRVYQGTGDFLLFATSNNAAGWNVQYVINADHNALTPYLIKCIAEFETKSSEPECWTQHRERFLSTSVPYFYTQTIFSQKQEVLYEFLFRDGVRFSVTTDDSEKILRIETTIDDATRNLFKDLP